ncbi:MAG: hypothetical protein GY853_14945 [PVC group bacterium]|nr:hypothetical protein [PVC group bacterium]
MAIHLLIIQVVIFIVIIGVLRFVFYRHLNTALKKLKELNEESRQKESLLRDELERAKREKEAEIEKGRNEAAKIVKSAETASEILRRNKEDTGRVEAERIIKESQEEVERIKRKVRMQAETEALELAVQMVEYTLTEQIKGQIHTKLIGEIIEQVEKIAPEKIPVKNKKIKIISTQALTKLEKDKLKNILSSKIGLDIEIEEEVNPIIVGGIIIQIGVFVIDGSLKNKLRNVTAQFKSKKN